MQSYEIIIFVNMKFIYPFLFLLILSCSSNIQNSKNVKIYRFENELFSAHNENISEKRALWEKEIGQFSDAYYSFINGKNSFVSIDDELLAFINNSDMKEVYDSIHIKFKNMHVFENELSESFNNLEKFFPEFKHPKIISMFSGFNYGVIVQDSILAIGLDFYLGRESIFYKRLNDPDYLRFQKQSKFLVPNVMEAWYDSFFNHQNNKIDFLSELIYKGKIMYLLEKTNPRIDFARLLRYSDNDLTWCQKSEASIWAFLIENDILFSTRYKDFRTYLNHAPFSKGMSNNSPSRIAYFVGYNIVKNYVKNNKVTLRELMNNQDSKSILKKSKYKP